MPVMTPSSAPAWGRRTGSAPAERGGICVDAGRENKYGVDMRVSEKVMASTVIGEAPFSSRPSQVFRSSGPWNCRKSQRNRLFCRGFAIDIS